MGERTIDKHKKTERSCTSNSAGRNIVAFFLVLAMLGGLVACIPVGAEPPRSPNADEGPDPGTQNPGLGILESIIEYNDDYAIGVHYPVIDRENIDLAVSDFIHGKISEFSKEVEGLPTTDPSVKAELNIDYETYLAFDNRLVSIEFTVFKNIPYSAHPMIVIETMVFDLETERQISLTDILKEGSLEEIAYVVRASLEAKPEYKDYLEGDTFLSGTEPTDENYSSFVLTDEYLIVLFQKYQVLPGVAGQPSVRIPYEGLDTLSLSYLEHLGPNGEDPATGNENGEEDGDNPSHQDPDSGPKRHIDPEKPMVALTFDDGPFYQITTSILDTLADNDAVATFFILGNRVSDNEALLVRMVNEGSEIGNHSYNHKQLTTVSGDELREQIDRTQAAVKEATGLEPLVLRPTYGSHDQRLRDSAGMPMVLWSIDPRDWDTKDANAVSKHILDRVTDGDIVLMHDIYPSTAEAVKIIVPALIDRGFQLVTVSELYEAKEVALEAGSVYRRDIEK